MSQSAIHLATDRLDEALTKAEARLYEMDIGARGDVRLLDGLDLTWEKWSGKWGLFIRKKPHIRAQEMLKTDTDPTPLLKADRPVRMMAAEQLPALLADIRARSAGELEELDHALASARQFASTPMPLCPDCAAMAHDPHFDLCGACQRLLR